MTKQIWEHDGPHELVLTECANGNLLLTGRSHQSRWYVSATLDLTIEEAHELMNALSRWLEREVVGPPTRSEI